MRRRSDVPHNTQAHPPLADVRGASRADALARSVPPQRPRVPLHAEGSALVLFPGGLPGFPAYTVKVHARFPGQSPAIQGVVQLIDLATGELLAVMDSGHLTALRTAVVGALATDVLARADASRVAIIGAGTQGVLSLKTLRLVRSLNHVRVHDTEPGQAEAFATRMYHELHLPVRPADTVAEAVEDADIIITSTASRQPFLHAGMVPQGAHVTTLGADEPGRGEVSAELLQRGRFFCDHRGLAVTSGAVGGAGLTEAVIQAELGEVIAGLKPGRASDEDITVFGAVGLPFQGLAAAWHVYLGAKEDEAVRRMDFLA